jgi:hypothetical protein
MPMIGLAVPTDAVTERTTTDGAGPHPRPHTHPRPSLLFPRPQIPPGLSSSRGPSSSRNTFLILQVCCHVFDFQEMARKLMWAKTAKATVATTAVMATMLTGMIQNSRFV